MAFQDIPIRRKLARVIMLTSASVLFITCTSFFVYEVLTFRESTIRRLSIVGEIIAANSTAALAFNSQEDAYEILSSLSAHPHIVSACIFDANGDIFTTYPGTVPMGSFPKFSELKIGYEYQSSHLIGVEPIKQNASTLGTLYIKENMNAIHARFRSYGIIAFIVSASSFLVSYLLSRKMQSRITKPIQALAKVATAISNNKDYTLRATKMGDDEIGILTESFNEMLDEIQEQDKAIKSFNRDLESRITERTNELQLVNTELESFTYSVSHDLRAPLRSVVGYSRIIMEDYSKKLDKEGIRILNVIVSNGQKMGRLIDDLLSFSKIGKQQLARIPLDMTAITEEVLTELEDQLASSKIILNDMLPAEGDKSMMKQVIMNLLTNALKYSSKREQPIIEIGSYRQDSRHVYYVKDNGVGFNMQYYDKLFGIFERLHSNTDFEGTGVGLALVNRIISKHSGEVWAEGQVDNGATFYFSLPIIVEPNS